MLVEDSKSQAMHVVIANEMRAQIFNQVLKHGDKISSEKILCRKFNASRGPIRQALTSLVNEGLIFRKSGKGTFVCEGQTSTNSRNTSKQLRIGVFMDVVKEMQFTEFVTDIITALHDFSKETYPYYNFSFKFHDTPGEVGRDFINEKDYDGFFFVPLGKECVDFLSSVPKTEKPIVSFFRQIRNNNISQFYINHEEGAFRAAEYLLSEGHRRIAIIVVGPVAERCDSSTRVAGYKRALNLFNVDYDPSLLIATPLNGAVLRHLIEQVLAVKNPPTALMIGGQALLSPSMKVLWEKRVTIPDDMSVITFDDCPDCIMHDPALTVVKQPFSRGIQAAMNRLVIEIEQSKLGKIEIPIKPELIIRDSCRRL